MALRLAQEWGANKDVAFANAEEEVTNQVTFLANIAKASAQCKTEEGNEPSLARKPATKKNKFEKVQEIISEEKESIAKSLRLRTPSRKR